MDGKFHSVKHQAIQNLEGAFEIFHDLEKLPGLYETKDVAYAAMDFPTYMLEELYLKVNVRLGRNIVAKDLI